MPTEDLFRGQAPTVPGEIAWHEDSQYRGFSWEDYILEGGYDSLWDGDYGQQIMQAVLYARSWSRPPNNHLFTFPVRIVPPAGLPGATILNFGANFIDGGTWQLGSKIRVVWQGTDGRRAFRDYNVKRFRLSLIQSEQESFDELIDRVKAIVQATTPETVENVFEFLQNTTINKLGVIQPGNTTIYTPSFTEPDRSGYLGDESGSSRSRNGRKSNIPWLLLAGLGLRVLL